MMISNRAFCECLLKNGKKPAYLYLFDRELPGSDDGSFHSSELWYVFGTVGRCWRPMTGVDFDLSRTMTKAWANFAKNANPNGLGVPEWDPYTAGSRCNMHFAPESKCEPISEPAVLKYLVEQKVK
jgi:para-nitrobenzyl esterase